MKRYEEHDCRYLLRRFEKAHPGRGGTPTGYLYPRLSRILSGSCRAVTAAGEVWNVEPGDVWFVPKGCPYVSYWLESAPSAFDVLEFDADFVSLYYPTMHVFHKPRFAERFAEIRKAQEENRPFAALASFYTLLSEALPQLERRENADAERLLPALSRLREAGAEAVRVEELAALCFLSPSRFYQLFRSVTGLTPIAYKNRVLLARAESLLQEGLGTQEICEILNVSSPSYLRRMMKQQLGMTPKQLRSAPRI